MGKIAFIFPGQGAQYEGMGKELAENLQCSKAVFEAANEALGFDLSGLCFGGPKEELDKTENTQPAILTTSIAALKALEEQGIKPDVVCGLSLGEYSALVASEVFNFSDAVKLVKRRGKFMQEAVPAGIGTMAAIMGLEAEAVRELCSEASSAGIIEPANFNCPGQIVIAGEIKAVEVACEIAKAMGAKRAIQLAVSAPFHTSMLKPAAEKLEAELNNVVIGDIKIPVITNVTAQYVGDKSELKEILKKQVMSSVLWEDTVRLLVKDGVDTFIEVGPGKVLSGFVKKVDKNLKVLNVEDMASLNKTIEALKNN